MPLFFFDVRDNAHFTRDDEGLEFPTIEKARDEAARALAEMAKFVLPGAEVRELAIEVRDAPSSRCCGLCSGMRHGRLYSLAVAPRWSGPAAAPDSHAGRQRYYSPGLTQVNEPVGAVWKTPASARRP